MAQRVELSTEREIKEILKQLAPALRAIGFRGSGQNFRKIEGDFVFVINFQGSRRGDNFFVNLGAQPTFVPAEGDANLERLKEYECILRRRVGNAWDWEMSGERVAALEADILSTQKEFFGNAQTMREALSVDSPETLIRKFCSGTTEARATLHLARAALALGYPRKAIDLAKRRIERAANASILISELKDVIDAANRTTPEQ